MITKTPKPVYKKWLKRGIFIGLALEGCAFLTSYYFWHKINTDREYRLYLHQNHPTLLDLYYKTGELLCSDKTRDIDTAFWEAQSTPKGL